MDIKIIDAHTHVQFQQYDKDRDGVIKRALESGIGMINAGADLESSEKAVDLTKKYDGVWATVGIHPTETQTHSDNGMDKPGFISEDQLSNQRESTMREIEKLAHDNKVVGIGECGLDLYREEDRNNKTMQEELFIKHIELSNKIKKPLVIHCREAFSQTFEILENHKNLLFKKAGIFHFFTGGIEEAEKVLDLGFSFTFGGLITYNRTFDEVMKYIPIENILVETDAPVMSIKSHRKERNEPSYVTEVIDSLSEIYKKDRSELEKIILENTRRIFSLS